MKKLLQYFFVFFVFVMLPCTLLFSGCDMDSLGSTSPEVLSIEKKETNGLVDTYVITYSNGKTSSFKITNGKDGANGKDGQDGINASNITANDLFEEYKKQYPNENITYKDFLSAYTSNTQIDNSYVINQCFMSCLKVYSQFRVTSYVSMGFWGGITTQKSIATSAGSAVVLSKNDDYTYIITNYHVIYNINANEDNGSKVASKIVGYLYGSEQTPVETNSTDENGYATYDYGDGAIEFEYVGGCATTDIAVLKAPTSALLAVNEDFTPIKFAEGYHAGQTAIAIGNPEDEGISVTEGIVSVESEMIALSVDGTVRNHRSLRIDTALYSGNSGGGLFNTDGELIGITNAGDSTDQNVNFAVPLEVVIASCENILTYEKDSDETTNGVYALDLGITTIAKNSKYVFDSNSGYGEIVENVYVKEVVEGGIASKLGLIAESQIKTIIINDVEYEIKRDYNIFDLMLNVRVGDVVSVKYDEVTSIKLTIEKTDLINL